uniref:Ribosomal protein S1 n=1 Tax=Hildenbrandia rivularis TaxID=135206 RepID=A0A1C9CFP8_9FLOR|nr:ribosomal protein S1 [Hildenbrandia rivularis]AOM67194.1 ribosomal protein S1 [Hildenbrandia rivularis]
MINNSKTKKITGFLRTSFKAILEQFKYNLNLGDIVAGSIFSSELYGYLVDIGDKNAAFLPRNELTITNNTTVNWKTAQEFFILSYDTNLSQLILSIKRLEYLRAWKRIQQLKNEDAIVYALVTGTNSGGLLINLDGISGFLPNSHITNLAFKQAMISTIVPLKFLFVNERLNKLLLSHRKATIFMSNFKVGNIINTKIIQVKDYGLLVQAQNIPALLHTSELPTIIFSKLKEDFQINEYLKIMIIHINAKQGRIAVSVKKLFV